MSCNKQGKIILATAFLSVFVLGNLFAQQQVGNSVRRIGLFVGANNGNSKQKGLSFAQSDAETVSKIFFEFGGINQEDLENNVLLQPNRDAIEWRLGAIKDELANAKRNGQRTEFIFYYSGHSEGYELNLGPYSYLLGTLTERIQSMEADTRIVILDMCYAGGAAKGPVTVHYFDNCAVFTSTKETEQAWEIPDIKSTYFTHSLITGLRGAADANGDASVTFKELYDFVNKEVKIESNDLQNPQFNPRIPGFEGTVLTNTSTARAKVIIGAEVIGRISIWDNSGNISNVNKEQQGAIELALEFGNYQFRLVRDEIPSRWVSQRLGQNNNNVRLRMKDFFPVTIATFINRFRARGSATELNLYEPPPGYSSPIASTQPVPILTALADAANKISDDIPYDNVVMIEVSSDHADLTEYIRRVLTTNVENMGRGKFEVIVGSRDELDAMQRALDHQMSGDVSDESFIPIGHNKGANTIITGKVNINYDNTYLLYVNAIDLEKGTFYSTYSALILNDSQMQALTSNWSNYAPMKRDDDADGAISLWSLGVSLGTTFSSPWFVGTVYGTLAPFRNSFIDLGVDFGFISGHTDVNYYSFYPFAHYAFFLPTGKNISWYAGAGAGYMLATYNFPEGEIKDNTFAFDLCTGIIIKSIFNLSYTLRTDFQSASNKLTFGYIKRF